MTSGLTFVPVRGSLRPPVGHGLACCGAAKGEDLSFRGILGKGGWQAGDSGDTGCRKCQEEMQAAGSACNNCYLYVYLYIYIGINHVTFLTVNNIHTYIYMYTQINAG